jgi:hypothetical protein
MGEREEEARPRANGESPSERERERERERATVSECAAARSWGGGGGSDGRGSECAPIGVRVEPGLGPEEGPSRGRGEWLTSGSKSSRRLSHFLMRCWRYSGPFGPASDPIINGYG